MHSDDGSTQTCQLSLIASETPAFGGVGDALTKPRVSTPTQQQSSSSSEPTSGPPSVSTPELAKHFKAEILTDDSHYHAFLSLPYTACLQ